MYLYLSCTSAGIFKRVLNTLFKQKVFWKCFCSLFKAKNKPISSLLQY